MWLAGLFATASLLSVQSAPVSAVPAAPPAPAASAAPPAAPAGNLVDNGSFELPDIPAGWVEFDGSAGNEIDPWSIDLGAVDLVAEPHWEAPDGNQVIDLDGSTSGLGGASIAQDVPTTPGTPYEIGFVYSGNPDCGDLGNVSAEVRWGGALVGTVSHDTVANAPDRTLAAFDYQAFSVAVTGAVEASRTALQIRSASSDAGTCGIVLDDVYVVHATPPVWQGTGPGTVSVSDAGTSTPTLTYDYEVACCAVGEWGLYKTATTTQTIDLDWSWTGYHAWFMVTAGLQAFVTSADGADTGLTLVDAGPASCCSGPPSGGFTYAGTVQLDIEPGDTYGFILSGQNSDSDGRLQGTLTLGDGAPAIADAPTLIQAVSTGGSGAYLIGRVDSAPSTLVTVETSTAASCQDGALVSGTPVSGGQVSVTTDGDGYFGINVTGVQPGDAVAIRLTAPATTDPSGCVVGSGDNDFWPKALHLTGTLSADDVIDVAGKARWYKFTVTPGQRITVSLTGVPADYDLAVFKDIGREFVDQLQPTDAGDLTELSAEYAPSVFSPSVFSPSVFSPSVFSPDAYAPSVFSPSVFSPSVFSPSVFSPSVFSPSVFSPSVFSPSVFSPSVFSPSVFSPSVFSPSVFSPSVFSPDLIEQAFSSAQTRSIIGVSATPGTGSETVVVNSWNNAGEFYVRVAGHSGAFDPNAQFSVAITLGTTSCGSVTDNVLTPRPNATDDGLQTVILTDSSKLSLGSGAPGTLLDTIDTFKVRPEVQGVLVDVASDPRVMALKAQANANTACPYAMNLVADEIKNIVDSYRAANPGLRYVVIAGGDDVIPFFRYPDQSLLGQESGYVPPVSSVSASEASLRNDFVLSQDAYGSGTEISLRTSAFPIPGLAVGRLIESPSEVAGMLQAYLDADGVVSPSSSLVTGYDFLEDAANAVSTEFQLGTGVVPDTLITPNGKSPQDPASWTAGDLRTKLLGSRHDISFLAGHFSANSALAADFATSVLSTELAGTPDGHFKNTIVFSAGCHSGYNIVDGDAIAGVTAPLDWAQAFAQEQATLIAGTGYQYGDTDFLEYSERLYRDFARELRAGTGAISIGEALVRAKLVYLSTTPDIRGIHEKALLEATLFGLPMLGVNMPNASGRGGDSNVGGAITPTAVTGGPAEDLGLAAADLTVAPTLTPRSLDLLNPPYDATATTTTASWLEGPDGVVTNPAEPALPLVAQNVTSTNNSLVLRGVGFRGGSYTDTSPIIPLSGAPTTELRGVHAPFVSPVFYPMKLWSPNYYGALGTTGGTKLLVTPVQHKSFDAVAATSIQRAYTGLDLRLFYSGNLSAASLSDAPTIVEVQGTTVTSGIEFSAQVVGDPSAGVHEVWVTHTSGPNGSGNGTWASTALVQCVAPLPAACGTTNDSRIWKGFLATTATQEFVIQAANGLGLVAFDDNRGSYYRATAAGAPVAVAPTSLMLETPPTSGAFGETVSVTAALKSDGQALAGKAITVLVAGSGAIRVTDATGRVTIPVALNGVPATTTVSASFAGDGAYAPSEASAPFTITKAPSSLSAFTQLSVVTPGGQSGAVTTLTATIGGRPQVLGQETVTFTLTGPSARTYSTITDYLGRAMLPTTGLVAGTYAVTAAFAGNATYTGTNQIGSLTVSAFTGFFSPVDNTPTVNVAKAGSTIPVKFSLGGDRGLSIFASGSPKAVKLTACSSTLLDPVEEASTLNGGLTYDPVAQQYKYNWKTAKSMIGCYRLELTFTDGTTRSALFQLK